jgi:nucleotide-binding universal stress UspA family protein
MGTSLGGCRAEGQATAALAEDTTMNLKKIVLPTDFSHAGDAALGYATVLARESGARLLIVHVSEPPLAYGAGEFYYGLPEPDEEAQRRMLTEVRPTDGKVVHEHRLLRGEPATAIADFAQREEADLIVMGTHGRTGLRRLVMGSVAEAVVRKAHCPVLTLREPATVPAQPAT